MKLDRVIVALVELDSSIGYERIANLGSVASLSLRGDREGRTTRIKVHNRDRLRPSLHPLPEEDLELRREIARSMEPDSKRIR